MKQYMEIGERGYYDKKRYRCVPRYTVATCPDCDMNEYCYTEKHICDKVCCQASERRDERDVQFKLQPKYRKEEKA